MRQMEDSYEKGLGIVIGPNHRLPLDCAQWKMFRW